MSTWGLVFSPTVFLLLFGSLGMADLCWLECFGGDELELSETTWSILGIWKVCWGWNFLTGEVRSVGRAPLFLVEAA